MCNGRIKIQFVGMNDQLADILTKPLPRVRFMEVKDRIMVIKVK
jgi:hypothetical protein